THPQGYAVASWVLSSTCALLRQSRLPKMRSVAEAAPAGVLATALTYLRRFLRRLASIVPQASHPAVTSDARCGRKLLAEQEAVSVGDRTAVTSATSCRTNAWFAAEPRSVKLTFVAHDLRP